MSHKDIFIINLPDLRFTISELMVIVCYTYMWYTCDTHVVHVWYIFLHGISYKLYIWLRSVQEYSEETGSLTSVFSWCVLQLWALTVLRRVKHMKHMKIQSWIPRCVPRMRTLRRRPFQSGIVPLPTRSPHYILQWAEHNQCHLST